MGKVKLCGQNISEAIRILKSLFSKPPIDYNKKWFTGKRIITPKEIKKRRDDINNYKF